MPASTHKVGTPINVWQALGNIFINQSTQLKANWDRVGEIVRTKHDDLCDYVDSDIATKQSVINAEAASKQYTDNIAQNLIIGQIPDNSLTDAKLGTDIKIGSLASLTTTIKISIVNAINELVTSLGTLTGAVSGHTTSISTLTNDKADKDTLTVVVASDKTLALSDKAKVLLCYSASTINITIPLNIFPLNSEIVIAREGAGAVTVIPASGVTVKGMENKTTVKLDGIATLKQTTTNNWKLYGALE